MEVLIFIGICMLINQGRDLEAEAKLREERNRLSAIRWKKFGAWVRRLFIPVPK